MNTPPIITKRVEMLNNDIKHRLKSSDIIEISNDMSQQSTNVSKKTVQLKQMLEEKLNNNPNKQQLIDELTADIEAAAKKEMEKLDAIKNEVLQKIESTAADIAAKIAESAADMLPNPVKIPTLPIKLAKMFNDMKEEIENKILVTKTNIEIQNNKALIKALSKS